MKKILVVDDNYAILDVLESLFQDEGFEVKCIKDAHDFMSVVMGFRPDLVILDIQLGKYDGRALCDHLMGFEDTRDIPVLLMSAKTDIHEMGMYTCIAQEFITKPFDLDDVVKRVSYQLNK